MGRTGDIAALIGRVGLGVVFIAHGWQKLFDSGVSGVAAGFAQSGVPLPMVSAAVATFLELGGGLLLILGLALPVVGSLLALQMLGAIVFVHGGNGLLAEGGYELVLVLGVASLAVGFNGGAFALDRMIFGGRTKAVPSNA